MLGPQGPIQPEVEKKEKKEKSTKQQAPSAKRQALQPVVVYKLKKDLTMVHG